MQKTWTAMRWVMSVLILLGVFVISSSRVAGAHAVLESSSPADQSVLDHGPSEVRLTFSEPVSLVVGSLRVFDSTGRQVQDGLPTLDATRTRLRVALRSDLADGSYAVAWRVISADSHPVHGGFVFSVGRSGRVQGLDRYLSPATSKSWEAAGDVLRAISYIGSFIVVGAALFVAFVEQRRRGERRAEPALAGIGAAAVVAELLQLPVAAALATGQGPGSLFESGVLSQVLGDGTALTIAGVGGAVVAALATLRASQRMRAPLAVASAIILAGGFVASGHTRTTDPVWGVILVDAVHVVAGAIWVGGLAMLVTSTRRRSRSSDAVEAAANEVVRFSRLATGSIIAVGAAGIALAWFEVGSWHGLFATGYGQLVIAKIVLVMLLAGLGAFNHFKLVPILQRKPDHAAAWRYLRRVLRVEALALVAVLGISAVLVNAIPSRTVASRATVYSASVPLGQGSANLVIDPARIGPTALHIYLLDPHGRIDDHERGAQIELYQTRLGIGPIEHELHRAGPGHFVTNGTLFTVQGTWQVTVRVRIDEFTENSATFSVDVHG